MEQARYGYGKVYNRYASVCRWVVKSLLQIFLLVGGVLTGALAQEPGSGQKRDLGLTSDSVPAPSPTEAKLQIDRPELVIQTEHTKPIRVVAVSPNGRWLASGSEDNTIKLWDATTGNLLRTLSGHTHTVLALAISPDGLLLASGSEDRTVKLWEVTSGQELHTLPAVDNNKLDRLNYPDVVGVRAVAFSSDGHWLTAASGPVVKVWEVTTGRELRNLKTGPERFWNGFVTLSSDGRWLSDGAVSGDSPIAIWDVTSSRKLRTLGKDSGKNKYGNGGIAISSDRRWLASYVLPGLVGTLSEFLTDSQMSIQLWDAATTRKTITLPGYGPVAFSSNGSRLVSGGLDRKGKLWDTATGRELQSLSDYGDNVTSVTFSPNDHLIVACSKTTLKLWDAATGHELLTLQAFAGREDAAEDDKLNEVLGRSLNVNRYGGNTAVAFSPDGRFLASRDLSGSIDLWDLTTGSKLRNQLKDTDTTGTLVFRPDGRLLALMKQATTSPRSGNTQQAWDEMLQRMEQMAKATGQGQGNPKPTKTNIDIGKMVQPIATVLETKEIKVWEGKTGQEMKPLSVNIDAGIAFVFSPDGRWLAAQNQRNTGQSWENSAKLATLLGGGSGQSGFGFGPSVRVWNLETGHELPIQSSNQDLTWPVTFSPDGRWLAAASMESGKRNKLLDVAGIGGRGYHEFKLKIWELPSGRPLRTLEGKPGFFETLAISPDGRYLAAGSGIETDPGNPLRGFVGSLSLPRVGSVGNAARQYYQPIKIWEVATGKELISLKGHPNKITAVAFGGRILASGSSDPVRGDNTIRLWNMSTGQELKTLTGHTSGVDSVAFDPTGRWLASSSGDRTTRIWNAQTGEPLALLVSLHEGTDWLVVTPEGLFDGSPAAWSNILWRFNQNTFDAGSVELFFNEFYYPGLLAEILSGKNPKPPRNIAKLDRRQPEVKLSAADGQLALDGKLSGRHVTLKIEIKEAPADPGHPEGSGAKDLRLFRNGSLVKMWRGDLLREHNRQVLLEATLPMVAGENRVTAYAFNHDNVKSSDASLTLTGAESIRRAGTAYIVVVGVNQYANPGFNLKYAVPDAQTFGEELLRQQSKLTRFDHIELIPLLDSEATKANILQALEMLAGRAKETLQGNAPAALQKIQPAQPEDAVVIYFAGHGTAQQQRFFLVPHDLGLEGTRTGLDEMGLKTILAHSISDRELELAFEKVDAGQFLLIIDACNSGQALEAEEKRRGPMNSKGLAQLAYEKGMYILTAAQAYQAALEAAQLGHGYLTYALVEEALKTGAADVAPKDGQVLLREWLDYATLRVPQMQEAGMQKARDLGREIVFVEGEENIKELAKRNLQRPRVFYRRESEAQSLVVAKIETK